MARKNSNSLKNLSDYREKITSDNSSDPETIIRNLQSFGYHIVTGKKNLNCKLISDLKKKMHTEYLAENDAIKSAKGYQKIKIEKNIKIQPIFDRFISDSNGLNSESVHMDRLQSVKKVSINHNGSLIGIEESFQTPFIRIISLLENINEHMNQGKIWKNDLKKFEVSYILSTAKSTVQAVHCDFASKKGNALIHF